MRKIIISLLLSFLVAFGYAQYTPMTAYGYTFKRIKCDSTLHIPSFCGVPSLLGSTIKNGAIALDTCGNNLYIWTNGIGWKAIISGTNAVAKNGLNGSDTIKLGGALTENTIIYGNWNFNMYGLKTIDLASTGKGEVYIDDSIVYLGGKYIYLDTDSTSIASSDTTTYKPLAYSSNHAIRAMKSWPKTDTISLSNRINLKLNISDTAVMLSAYLRKSDTTLMLSKYLRKSDTAAMLTPYLRKADTTAMLSKYLRKVDTTAMLNPYLRKADTTSMLNPYLRKADTTAMLSKYLRKVDTTLMLLPYLRKVDTTLMLSKYLRKIDTTAMLSPYLRKIDTTNRWVNNIVKKNDSTITFFKGNTATDITLATGGGGTSTDTTSLSNRINAKADTSAVNLKLNISDTASMLTNYAKISAVNLKLNISDTANMLAKYLRKIDTTNKWVNDVIKLNDSTIIVSKGSTNTSIVLPRGTSGGSGTVTSISQGYGIANSPNPITSTGTITIDTATLSTKYLRLIDTSYSNLQSVLNKGNTATGKSIRLYSSAISNAQILMNANYPNIYPYKDAFHYAILSADNTISTNRPQLYIQGGTGNDSTQIYVLSDSISFNKYGIYTGSNGAGIRYNNNNLFSLRADSIALNQNNISSDTTTYKPIGVNGAGKIAKMNNWLSGGNSTVYVDSIYRTAGKDSIYYKKNGNTYAIKDSVGNTTGFVPYTGATSNVNLGTKNISANAYFNGFTSMFAKNDTIVLSIDSTPVHLVKGSGGQAFKLPVATTLSSGTIFSFNNNQSSGVINVISNSIANTLVKSVPSGAYLTLELTDNTTATGTWDAHFLTPSNVSWSTNTLDYNGSITSAQWNGTTVAYNRGGTGQSSTFTQGGVTFGSTTTALGTTAAGTSGQMLLSAGTGTPTWADTSVFLRKSDSSTYYTKYRSDTSRTNIYSAINNKITDSAWVSGNSWTISGWSGTTTKLIQYRRIGNGTILVMWEIVGTGIGATTSITLPFTSTSWGNQITFGYSLNGSTSAAGLVTLTASSTALTFSPSFNPGAAWGSGTARTVKGQMIINIQ
jgi:hypothetical protein